MGATARKRILILDGIYPHVHFSTKFNKKSCSKNWKKLTMCRVQWHLSLHQKSKFKFGLHIEKKKTKSGIDSITTINTLNLSFLYLNVWVEFRPTILWTGICLLYKCCQTFWEVFITIWMIFKKQRDILSRDQKQFPLLSALPLYARSERNGGG